MMPTIKGEGGYLLTKLDGFLDHLRENLKVLDEQIENARVMSKSKKKGDNALQWTKTLRDLVELRSVELDKIKTHLLGRGETGVSNEPNDIYEDNPEVMFERDFKTFLAPWTQTDLELKCEDCGVESEDVTHREFANIYDPNPPWGTIVPSEEADLCPECASKREVSRQQRVAETQRPAQT
jgi:hypothetical protein